MIGLCIRFWKLSIVGLLLIGIRLCGMKLWWVSICGWFRVLFIRW